jgi:hydroxypyruvate reductase
VVTKDGHDGGPEGFETVFASHPEPDERGVEASRKVRELAESLGEGDLLLALISAGPRPCSPTRRRPSRSGTSKSSRRTS